MRISTFVRDTVSADEIWMLLSLALLQSIMQLLRTMRGCPTGGLGLA